MTSELSWRRRTAFLFAVCLGLVVLADWLFYRQPIGWTASLYALALVAAVTLRNGHYLRTWPGRIIAAGMGGIVVSLLIEPGVLAVTLGLMGLVTLAIIDRGGWTHGAAALAFRWVRFLGHMVVQPVHDARLQERWQRSRGERFPALRAFGRWFIPVVLSAVFVGLFALANPIISDWLGRLPEHFAILRMVMWVLVGLSVWGLLRVRLRRQKNPLPTHARALPALGRADLIVRCLIAFNAVFAVQTLLDLWYLWGEASLPEGMSYATYAHRGAYPLVATALLAGIFVILTFRGGHRDTPERRGWTTARRLCYLWIAQNILLMISAAYRLGIYIDNYSLTRWRIAAAIWMALVAVGFVWLIWRIIARRDNRWLLQVNAVTAAIVLYACCFVNFDGIIADYNVRHCAEVGGRGAPIDLAYLESLGAEALPAIRWLEAQPVNEPLVRAEAILVGLRLQDQLNASMSDWRGWTVRRASLLASTTKP